MHRIAIIDDESSVTETLSFFLSQFYIATTFSDGSEFLKVAAQTEIDLVITDFMMPEVDGITLASELRKMSQYQNVPIVMITALGDTELENAKNAGINDYVTKPFDILDVLKTIQKYLS